MLKVAQTSTNAHMTPKPKQNNWPMPAISLLTHTKNSAFNPHTKMNSE